jgi:hypothetical protein
MQVPVAGSLPELIVKHARAFAKSGSAVRRFRSNPSEQAPEPPVPVEAPVVVEVVTAALVAVVVTVVLTAVVAEVAIAPPAPVVGAPPTLGLLGTGSTTTLPPHAPKTIRVAKIEKERG